jgi:hypothetical protein
MGEHRNPTGRQHHPRYTDRRCSEALPQSPSRWETNVTRINRDTSSLSMFWIPLPFRPSRSWDSRTFESPIRTSTLSRLATRIWSGMFQRMEPLLSDALGCAGSAMIVGESSPTSKPARTYGTSIGALALRHVEISSAFRSAGIGGLRFGGAGEGSSSGSGSGGLMLPGPRRITNLSTSTDASNGSRSVEFFLGWRGARRFLRGVAPMSIPMHRFAEGGWDFLSNLLRPTGNDPLMRRIVLGRHCVGSPQDSAATRPMIADNIKPAAVERFRVRHRGQGIGHGQVGFRDFLNDQPPSSPLGASPSRGLTDQENV